VGAVIALRARRLSMPVAFAAALATVLLVLLQAQGDRTSTPVAPTETLFQDTVPGAPSVSEGASVELGVVFEVAETGWVEGIRFFRGAGNDGPHRGSLWTADGERLGTLTFADGSASGWQEATFASPIPVEPGQTYVASYHAPQGHYAADLGFYAQPHLSGRVSGLGSLYRYGPGDEFPDATHRHANYWVDLAFVPAASPAPNPNPTPTPTPTQPAPPQPSHLNLPRIPWEGGPAYWKRFQKTDAAGWDEPTFFPISVFLGKPSHAPQLQALGINTYMGAEHDGTAASAITDLGLYLMAQQDEWALSEVGDDPGVVAWFISDECDMGLGGCGGGDEYDGLRIQKGFVNKVDAYQDGRFKHANFGNGILETHWSPNTMNDHVALVDSASADKYTYTSPHVWSIVADSPAWPSDAEVRSSASYGWQADQMRKFQNPEDPRPIWTFVETARPFLTEPGAQTITPDQIEGAVWSAIIHEARGIAYFQHNNDGTCGTYSLVDCGEEVRERVAEINSKVRSLAPVLNTQSYEFDFRSQTDTMLKVHKGDAHIFAGIGLADSPGEKTFVLPPSVLGTTVTVVGEDRTLQVEDGKFTDTFPAEHTHHVYKVSLS
jgi:hypothetical protein